MEENQTETQKDQETKEETNSQPSSLHKSGAGGVNLIATRLEKVEKETEKKFQIDLRVVLFVLFVVLVSLGIVGYNWYVSMELSTQQFIVEDLEEDLMGHKYTVESNNQILERYDLYSDITEGFISSKEVLSFWQEISENLGEIIKISLTDGVGFEVNGKSDSLRDVTELWHFLSIDDRVSVVTLEGMSIPSRNSENPTLSFSFKGTLNLEYFNKKD